MLQFYSPMFTYNKIIKGTDTGVRTAASRRLDKQKICFQCDAKVRK